MADNPNFGLFSPLDGIVVFLIYYYYFSYRAYLSYDDHR